ncbi:MAG TPA: dihydrodipicolinate synthase family protein [Xanthobacteraceae bacterium]|nr:dihydrodipicolinate synthase family protein [Xanthobacteraceae bacterium]
MKENAPATGVWPPAATPFHADLSIDFERYIAHCKSLLADGAHGLAVLGTTSEANSLDLGERESVLEKLIASGIAAEQLLPGTGAASIGDAVRLTRHAVARGVRGVLLLPPFYYKGVSEDGLFAFVSEVIGRVGQTSLQIYLYNFPQMTGIAWPPSLIGHLIKSFPKTIVGLKDSSGDVAYMNRLLESFPGFAVFPSSEALLLAAMKKSAAGCISATANTQVGAIRALYDGWQGAKAEELSRAASAVRLLMQKYPLIAAVKAVLAEHARAPDWARVRPPLDPLSPAQRKELAAELSKLEAGATA